MAVVGQVQIRALSRRWVRGLWCRSPSRRIERNDRLDRAAPGSQPSHLHRGGQEVSADLGHHALGQRQRAGIGVPGRLERDGLGAVAAARQAEGTGGAQAEGACGRPADEATEHRTAVEARDTQLVDRPLRADQRGAAGVAEKGVVLDGGAQWVTVGRRPGCARRVMREHHCLVSVNTEQDAQRDAVAHMGREGDQGCLGAVVEAE